MDFLRKLIFGDWILYNAFSGEWTIHEVDFGYTTTKKCVYEVFYSPSRNLYKIKLSGYKPKKHKMYPEVARYVGKLNEELMSGNEQHKLKEELTSRKNEQYR
jgi:hypothetical protein